MYVFFIFIDLTFYLITVLVTRLFWKGVIPKGMFSSVCGQRYQLENATVECHA